VGRLLGVERRAAMCGGMLSVGSSGDEGGLWLRGEGTRGRDHWIGLKTMGSKVGLRFAGRLLKLRGRTGNGGRGMAHGAEAAVDWEAAEAEVVEEGMGTLKRGAIVRESFRTRGRSGVDAGSSAGSGWSVAWSASLSSSSSCWSTGN
jgi:hypothetical protein